MSRLRPSASSLRRSCVRRARARRCCASIAGLVLGDQLSRHALPARRPATSRSRSRSGRSAIVVQPADGRARARRRDAGRARSRRCSPLQRPAVGPAARRAIGDDERRRRARLAPLAALAAGRRRRDPLPATALAIARCRPRRRRSLGIVAARRLDAARPARDPRAPRSRLVEPPAQRAPRSVAAADRGRRGRADQRRARRARRASRALAVFGSAAIEGAQHDLQHGLDAASAELSARADAVGHAGGEANDAGDRRVPARGGIAARRTPRARACARAPLPRAASSTSATGARGSSRRRATAATLPADRESPASRHARRASACAHGGWCRARRARATRATCTSATVVTLPDAAAGCGFRLAADHHEPRLDAGAIARQRRTTTAAAWASADVSALQVDCSRRASLRERGAADARCRRCGGSSQRPRRRDRAASASSASSASTRQGLSRLTQIARLVLVSAALALAAAMGGVVWQPAPAARVAQADGFERRPTCGARCRWRARSLLGIGCSIGALLGLYGQYMLSRWLSDSTGFPTAYAPAWLLALSTFAGVTLVAVAIAALPGFAAARVPTRRRAARGFIQIA